MKVLRLVNICLLMSMLVGFRWFAEKRWEITKEKPTIWLEFDQQFYGTNDFGDKVRDLDGILEPLKNIAPEQQRTELLRIMLADFDSVDLSFVRLRLKPGQISSIDELYSSPSEETYDPALDSNRIIKLIVNTSSSTPASGFASSKTEGKKIIGCNITIAPRTLSEPRFLIHVMSHEILHCLGLDHQQDDSDSIMSYSNNSPSLSIDDRMALTYLYPSDPDIAKEQPTFGLMCTPAK